MQLLEIYLNVSNIKFEDWKLSTQIEARDYYIRIVLSAIE